MILELLWNSFAEISFAILCNYHSMGVDAQYMHAFLLNSSNGTRNRSPVDLAMFNANATYMPTHAFVSQMQRLYRTHGRTPCLIGR